MQQAETVRSTFAAMRARAIAGAVVGLVSLSALANQASAQSAVTIVVEGNRRVDASTVRSYFGESSGKLDDAALDAGLKRLLATNLFDKVTIEQSDKRLIVHLAEAPVLDHVAFEGNKKIKDTELTAAVDSKPRGTLQRAVVQADVGRIMEVYRHAGRDDVGDDVAFDDDVAGFAARGEYGMHQSA